ncbi:outer membrane protein assembly factor BamB family protein [Thalassoroseus pseudoceratinae]|uniref:outer membrane protein assembly factor BamB family protein n=1 Tax=Thalassoroseus pseudoceratinae TaxID=2713176 RepID=UPI00141FC35E|nr:PQQ-binding-like beta-propeller repeat protein [Thalassoroseus pseudoceratinae]
MSHKTDGVTVTPEHIERDVRSFSTNIISLTAFLLSTGLWYQSPVRGEGPAAAQTQKARPAAANSPDAWGLNAPWRVNRGLQQLLRRADQFAAENRFQEAISLWQEALNHTDRAASTSTSQTIETLLGDREREKKFRYGTFQPIRREIEARLAQLPDSGSRLYRLQANTEAQVLLNLAENESPSQADRVVTQRYFLSDHGDDALWRRASEAFDRQNFVVASRMIDRIVQEHPRSSIPRDWLLLRKSVAEARLGELREAKASWTAFLALNHNQVPSAIQQAVGRELERMFVRADRSGLEETSYQSSSFSLGRTFTGEPVTESWIHSFEYPMTVKTVGSTAKSQTSYHEILERWQSNGWRPTVDLVSRDGKLYFYGTEHVSCCDAATGRFLWRTTHGNEYAFDGLSKAYGNAASGRDRVRPSELESVRLFGDRVHPMLTVSHGHLYCLEGRVLDIGKHSPGGDSPFANSSTNRTRLGPISLAAYDANSGKLKWSKQATEAIGVQGDAALPCGFLAAPAVSGNQLFVPVSRSGEIVMLALSAATGETIWQTTLCDEPSSGAVPWSPVGLNVSGSDLYVATGMGLVFAFDVQTGQMHWATRYDRTGVRKANAGGRPQASDWLPEVDGWETDQLIADGSTLIVLPSDLGRLVALDRRTGALKWDSPRSTDTISYGFDADQSITAPTATREYSPNADEDIRSAEYLIGHSKTSLYVGGRRVVRCYGTHSGKLIWEAGLENACGRGIIVNNSLYVPDGRTIRQLDLETGSQLGRTSFLSATDEPVGNLASDGQRLFVVGCERVLSLIELDEKLHELRQEVLAGDTSSSLLRMKLNARQGDLDQSVADLRVVERMLRRQSGPRVARQAVVDGLIELDLANSRPELTVQWLADIYRVAIAETISGSDAHARNDDQHDESVADSRPRALLATALTAMTKSAQPPSTPIRFASAEDESIPSYASDSLYPILQNAWLWRMAKLEDEATRAVARIVAENSASYLFDSLANPDPLARRFAIAGLEQLQSPTVLSALEHALEDPADSVRLRSAVALLNRGHQESLWTLISLLNSPELSTRRRAIEALRSATAQQFGYHYESVGEADQAAIEQWLDWFDQSGLAADLKLPVRVDDAPIGRLLLTNNKLQRLRETDANGDEVWSKNNVKNIWSCRGLPDGHRVITTTTSPRAVIEYNENGQEIWKKSDLPGTPFSAVRLSNGHLLVACNNKKVYEFRRDETVARTIELPGIPHWVSRLENGNILIALTGSGSTPSEVREVDLTGKVVWQVKSFRTPVAAHRLPNGNTLVADSSTRLIQEFNANGQPVWVHRWQGNQRLNCVHRTSDGKTLVVDDEGLAEIDLRGRVTRRIEESGMRCLDQF